MLPIRRAFALTDWQQEVVVSSTVLAAFAGSLAGGSVLNDLYGRRGAALCAAATFCMGSLLLLVAPRYYAALVAGRLVVGAGIGIASLTTPVYIAEVALPRMRGRLVTVNALMVYVRVRHLCHVSCRVLLFHGICLLVLFCLVWFDCVLFFAVHVIKVVGWLVGWLAGWLVGCLIGCFCCSILFCKMRDLKKSRRFFKEPCACLLF